MSELLIFSIAFIASYFGVEIFRRWSLHAGLLDVPNNRSSHGSPTPRGAGLIIVLVSLILYSVTSHFLTHNFKWHYVVAASLVASISWLDDLYSIPFAPRLLVHSVSAAILIWGVGFWTGIYLPGFGLTLEVGNFGAIIAFLWIVWMINAYNFMDGIDGIASAQAVLAGVSWLLLGYVFGYTNIYFTGGILAFSCLGFLIHNWSPAKVFMGDIGSAFLGFTFAALPLIAVEEKPSDSPMLLFAGVIFVWFFLFDTVFTFFRRAVRGEKVWTAHREHLYQRMTKTGHSHGYVTLLYAGFTAIVIASLFAGIIFRGKWEFLAVFTTLLLSSILILYAYRESN
ncbi:MAG: glycosyltransferase family 4 protein [Pyrinomonadaceae bacterium]